MSKMTLDEVVGSLVVQEQRLHECQVREEKQALHTRSMGKEKVNLGEESSSHGCGRGYSRGKGRGQGRGKPSKSPDADEERQPFDKSKVRCYNYQKLGHFASECHSGKKRKDEKANLVAQEDNNESTLLMAFLEEVQSFLLQNQDASILASDL